MKYFIVALILACIAGFLWMQHELNRVADESRVGRSGCATWISEKQKGCE